MDTYILIPDEFGLVLTLHPNPCNILEMSVAIWSNDFVPQGTFFYPDLGKLRVEKLEVYSKLPADDVSNLYKNFLNIFLWYSLNSFIFKLFFEICF